MLEGVTKVHASTLRNIRVYNVASSANVLREILNAFKEMHKDNMEQSVNIMQKRAPENISKRSKEESRFPFHIKFEAVFQN